MEYEQKSGASLADAIAAKEAELDKERAALEAAEAAGARHAAEGEATQVRVGGCRWWGGRGGEGSGREV